MNDDDFPMPADQLALAHAQLARAKARFIEAARLTMLFAAGFATTYAAMALAFP